MVYRIVALLLFLACADSAFAAKPNIVVFLSDDHTLRDSSVYGSPDIKTPNMDRLAASGMTFDQAYVASPSCAPSRAALLTGLYPANNGAEPNHSRPRADIKKLPAYLHELGYEVVSFGKVGHYKQTEEYGFDLAKHFNYHEDVAIPEALKWLRERNSEKPLCLFVGTNWPHVPWPEDAGDIDPAALKMPPNHVDNDVTRQWRSRYVAAIKKMDDELGQVYDLAKEKLGDDVFILHTADHGAQWPFGKWNLYDDGIRTPLIVSWKGHVQAGVRTSAMVSWIDILPTVVDVAGGKAGEKIDGRSFLPVLTGSKKDHRDKILTTHSGDGDFNVYPIRSVKTADGWKYIRNLRPDLLYTTHVTKNADDSGYWGSWMESAVTDPRAREIVKTYQERPAEELYNVADDKWEQKNLIDDPAQVTRLASMRQQLDQWMTETKDPQKIYGRPKTIAEKGKPNLVVVLIDDMGWSDMSCFGGEVETQNIDRMASEGIKFTQFYVNSPICSPSRVALATGQYPHRWKITSFLNNRKANNNRGMAQWLPVAAPMLARELQANGYATGHFGKWHMGGQRDVHNAPPIVNYGFDRALTNFEGKGPKLLPLTMTPESDKPGKIWEDAVNIGGGPVTWMQRSEITTGFIKNAIEFIDEAEAVDRPFYINLWPDDVHSPFFPPVSRWGNNKRELYKSVLDSMDEQFALLFDRIRNDEKLRDNTFIVFCSDNGPEQGAGTSNPYRGSKGWLYEGGIRSNMITWGPGFMADGAAGTTNSKSVFSSIDVNRSLYTIAGIPVGEGQKLDGEDVSDVLTGKSKASRSSPIFFRRPPDRPGENNNDNPDLAVRDGQWKFLINYDGSDAQLYDVSVDQKETTNVASKHAEVVDRLKAAVFAWNKMMPADAGDPSYVPQEGEKKPAAGGE